MGAAVVGGGILLLIVKGGKKKEEKAKEEEVYELVEEEPIIKVEEEEETGCPEDKKRVLLAQQEKLFKDAHKVYLVITNMFKGKTLPPDVKQEFETFLRSYNRLKELKEEIEVYPFSDCDKVFQLKFNFYNKLIKETAQKLMVMSRSLK